MIEIARDQPDHDITPTSPHHREAQRLLDDGKYLLAAEAFLAATADYVAGGNPAFAMRTAMCATQSWDLDHAQFYARAASNLPPLDVPSHLRTPEVAAT